MIPLFKIHTPEGVGKYIQEVFDSGFITEGEKSDQFEEKFGKLIENKDVAIVNSCTSALTIAYDMANVGPGDEVISTPMTCMATNEPIHNARAKIVWADIDPETGNILPESVIKKITSKTKAIVGVHWSGLPFDIDAINKIAKDHGLKVIEDAAHALGATYKGKKIGNHSDYVCFSFQAIKHLTTVDGGAISTTLGDKEIEIIRKIKWFGLDRKFKGQKWSQDISRSGYKFHMNNVNSAIGLLQMEKIDSIVKRHIDNGHFYDQEINNKYVKKLSQRPDVESAYWIYTLIVDSPSDFSKFLADKGITSDVVHVRNDQYSVFKDYRVNDLPGCDFFCSRMINIPVGWWLTEEQIKYIVDTVNSYKP